MSDETPTQHISQSLWDRILNFFDGMWERVFKTNIDILNPFFSTIASRFSDNIDSYVVSHLIKSLTEQLKTSDIPDDVKDTIETVVADRSSFSLLMGYLFTAVYQITTLSAHSGVAALKATQKWNQTYEPHLPDVNTLIVNLFRDPELELEVKEMLSKHGFNEKSINLLLTGAKTILDPDQIKTLFLRNAITEETHDKLLKYFGYSDGDIKRVKILYYPIPSYPDLINMAVREAFQPDYVEEYDLLKEYPGDFELWAKKQGLSEDWCKKYWASHWTLPSILQGYEMLHRDVITTANLDSLFMAQDIMPFWRDKLRAISYNPLTRVDVRRVFRMGIIGVEDVKRTYLDLGYDNQKATWLTNFTVAESLEKERDLTKAEVLNAYGKKIIAYDTCKNMLTNLGYSESEVQILITNKEYSEYQKTKTLNTQRIKKMFLAGVYDRTEAISELGKMDLSGTEQAALVNEWDAEKLSKLRNLTKKEYDGLFQAKIINESTYRSELANLGYITKHINWSLQLLKTAPAEG